MPAELVCEQEIGKIHAGDLAEPVKTPDPRIYVEQFVLSVSGILLEFNLNQSVEIDGAQKPLRQFFDLWQISGLDIGCRATEFPRMLAQPSSGQNAVRGSVPEKGAIGELAVAVSGNDLLDHDFTHPNVVRRGVKKRI